LFIFVVLGKIGFESLGELAAGEHDASSTSPAFQPNICAQPDHGPFIGAAGVLFAQAQVVVQLEVSEHNVYR
jgi:hypothetical protein